MESNSANSGFTRIALDDLAQQALQKDPGTSGRVTVPVVSYPGFKLLVVAMKKGSTWAQHSTAGRISVQTLTGEIKLRAMGQDFNLSSGNLMALDSNIVHDLAAMDDSTFLLTVSKPGEG